MGSGFHTARRLADVSAPMPSRYQRKLATSPARAFRPACSKSSQHIGSVMFGSVTSPWVTAVVQRVCPANAERSPVRAAGHPAAQRRSRLPGGPAAGSGCSCRRCLGRSRRQLPRSGPPCVLRPLLRTLTTGTDIRYGPYAAREPSWAPYVLFLCRRRPRVVRVIWLRSVVGPLVTRVAGAWMTPPAGRQAAGGDARAGACRGWRRWCARRHRRASQAARRDALPGISHVRSRLARRFRQDRG